MDEQRAQRTLVKSPPELWAEISDLEALGRHLGEFGDICITRSEPETAVAWEGDRARGTVELRPAGWGTRVTLTAVPVPREAAEAPDTAEVDAAAEEDAVAAPEAEAEPGVTRRGLWARLRSWLRPGAPEEAAGDEPADEPPGEGAVAGEPAGTGAAEEEPEPSIDPDRAAAILVEVLDDLGAARHRPFSRMA